MVITRVIRLGPGECPDPETGARYFAALAFPGLNDEQARINAVRGWTGDYLYEANKVDKSSDPFEDQRLNQFLQMSPAWCKARVRTGMRRLRDRSHAARAVRPWVRDLLNRPHPPVPGIRKFTQRQIALYLSRNDPECSANFQHRVWRPTRPVLHLAIAYDLILSNFGDERREYFCDLASVATIDFLVMIAELIRPQLLSDPRFGINEREQLQLEWVV